MTEVTTTSLPVLVFAPFGKDSALIDRVLRQSSVSTQLLSRFQDLEDSISEDAGAAIITEEVLQNGAISALAQKLSAQPPWSDFAIIVLTGSGMSTASTDRQCDLALPWETLPCSSAPCAPLP